MLDKLFLKILSNKQDFLKARNGDEFEKLLQDELYILGYNNLGKKALINIIKKVEFNSLKEKILNKFSDEYIENTFSTDVIINKLVYQPFGANNYPDFLIITKTHIIPLEIKYSKKSNEPVWNSNMPKPNSFYIFGSHGKQDVTFFRGRDVLDKDSIEKITKFFDEPRRIQQEFYDNVMPTILADGKNAFGFKPYVRIAYETSAQFSTDDSHMAFDRSSRVEDESKLITTINELSK